VLAGFFHFRHVRHQIIHLDDEPIPSARPRMPSVWHGPSGGALRSGEPESEILVGDASESRGHALIELESERLRIESNRTIHIAYEISNGCHDVSLLEEGNRFISA
jgi:hypothetical protein